VREPPQTKKPGVVKKYGQSIKALGLAALVILCSAWVLDYTTELTGDAVVRIGRAEVYGMVVMTDGTNAVTVDMFDNTVTGGTKIMPTWTVTTSATDRAQSIALPHVPVSTGIYVDITCAGTVKYMVYYREK
jgi:hypothetical protein